MAQNHSSSCEAPARDGYNDRSLNLLWDGALCGWDGAGRDPRVTDRWVALCRFHLAEAEKELADDR